MSKRVLILTERWYPDTFGGSERLAAIQVDGLLAAGFWVTVFCSNLVEGLPTDETLHNGQLRVVRAGSLRSMPGQAMYSILVAARPVLRLLLAAQQFDIVICHHPLIGAVYLHLAPQHPPIITIFHSSRPQEIRFEGLRQRPPLHALWTRLVVWQAARSQRRLLTASYSILYLSQFSKQILTDQYPNLLHKANYLRPGLPIDQFTPPAARDWSQQLIVTVRRLTPRMGLDRLIAAASILQQRGYQFRIDIAGTGELQSALKQQITAAGLEQIVRLRGRISDADLHKTYQRASCFVLPTSGLEGFGIATLEALLSGLPVIGTPVGATPELLSLIDTKLLTQDSSAEAIAAGIAWFLDLDAKARAALSVKCRSVAAEQFNAEAMQQQLVASVQAVLAADTTTPS